MTILELRKTLGMSQVAMAKALGVSKNTLLNWEYGGGNPNAANQAKIDAMLDGKDKQEEK